MRITREMIRATFKCEQQKHRNIVGLGHGTGSMAEFKRFFYYRSRQVGGSLEPCLPKGLLLTLLCTSLFLSSMKNIIDSLF